jgi:hypothetical protein
VRNRAKIVELEAALAEMHRRSEGTSSILREQTEKWLSELKRLVKTCDTQCVSRTPLQLARVMRAAGTRRC